MPDAKSRNSLAAKASWVATTDGHIEVKNGENSICKQCKQVTCYTDWKKIIIKKVNMRNTRYRIGSLRQIKSIDSFDSLYFLQIDSVRSFFGG